MYTTTLMNRIVKKWRHLVDYRLPMLQRKVHEELQPTLSHFDIQMMIENQHDMRLEDKKIADAIAFFTKKEYYNRCHAHDVKTTPLFHLTQYLTTYNEGQSPYFTVLIKAFMSIIDTECISSYNSLWIRASKTIHDFCQQSGLIANKDIAQLLRRKREIDLSRFSKAFREERRLGGKTNARDLWLAFKGIEYACKYEDKMLYLTTIQAMKQELSEYMLYKLDLNAYAKIWIENGILPDNILSHINCRLEQVEGNDMHERLLGDNIAIFTSGTTLSLTLLMKMINALDQDTHSDSYYQLVFDTSGMLASRFERSILDIINKLVEHDKQFLEKNPTLCRWLEDKAQALWLKKVKNEGWSNIESVEDALNIIGGILRLRLPYITDDSFLKIARVFPSGPCNGFIDAVHYLVKNGKQVYLKGVFYSGMETEHIKTIKRILSVPTVKRNKMLQQKIQAVLKLDSMLPYFVKECLALVAGIDNVRALPPELPSNMRFFTCQSNATLTNQDQVQDITSTTSGLLSSTTSGFSATNSP